MQPLQRPQPQQQQQQLKSSAATTTSSNQLLHLQMPNESSSDFMDSASNVGMSGSNTAGNCSIDINTASTSSTSSLSAPPSPLSISSVSSSASSTNESTNMGPPSLGVNLRVTGQCSQGGRKYMEDFFSVAYQHSENAKDLEYAFFGIFDGHGGAEAATFAKEHLMMEIINQKLFWSDSDQDVLRAIREGYIATHFAMWREQDKWPKTANGLPSTAGTTATVAFIRHEKIYIGHVGDSGIVLGYQNEGEKCWRAKQLTIDHKPESVAERSRIMRAGGKVVVKSGVPRVVWNRPRNACHRGPIRHNTPVDEIPFLAVARSLGDLWSYNSMCNEFVVSPDPDVRVIKINPKTFRCLVFGTDGLWNVVTPQEAVHTVYQNEYFNEVLRTTTPPSETNWKNPSQSLVYKALNMWSAKKMRADNTSVVTVILHPPNDSGNETSTSTAMCSSSSKLEASLNDCYGLEYTMQSGNWNDDTVTYREMAQKYLPPVEYQNFNYYDDACLMEAANQQQKTYYEDRYAKLSASSRTRHFGMPTTIASLEFMCGNQEMERLVGGKTNKIKAATNIYEAFKEIDIKLDNGLAENGIGDGNAGHRHDDDDDDDTDEEDCEDMCDDDEEDENDEDEAAVECCEADRTHEHDDTTIVMPNSESSDYGLMNASNSSSSSSYMSTFAESYNTLLNGDTDGVVNDGDSGGQISAEVSTSNSSHSYKSHCSSSMHELMQEQQRYQQQCMSEEEGYSLTKLETRREQQRCSASGVQTFRIFQQQQQQQQEMAADVSTQTSNSLISNTNSNNDHESNYLWQDSTQPLELSSLLQQEREEERQVELERQMELERLQQQQTLDAAYQNTDKSLLSTCDDSTNDTDITIEEEYLLDDSIATKTTTASIEIEAAADDNDEDDATVQINEISSSSCTIEIEATTAIPPPPAHKTRASAAATKLASISCSTPRLSPMPSSSSLSSTIYDDSFTATPTTTTNQHVPKFIEKLEEIEILHEKPELVIETTTKTTASSPTTSTMMSTRSRHKAKLLTTTPSTETKPRPRAATTRFHYRNIPNENQQQQGQQRQLQLRRNAAAAAVARTTTNTQNLKSNTPLLRFTATTQRTIESRTTTNLFNNKRQLRSTYNGSNNGSKTFSSVGSNNNNSIEHAIKRTLRTRNTLSKDLKAKSSLVAASTLKRTSSNVTTRFLRTQSAVSLLNMPQNTQVFVKKPNCTTTVTNSSLPPSTSQLKCQATTSQSRQHHHQQQHHHHQKREQLPLSATSFNLINLRSRQIAGNNFQKTAVNLTPTHTNSAATTTNSANSAVAAATAAFIRRNLRSKLTTTATTSAPSNVLPNYCKSMRSHSAASLMMTAPPPSPKHFNGNTSNITIAVTRARTTNSNIIFAKPCIVAAAAATNSTKSTSSNAAVILNSQAQVNRKRGARNLVEHFNTNVISTRAPAKRLKR